MDKVFENLIRFNMEVYVYDMVIKSTSTDNHPTNPEKVFNRIQTHSMHLNLEKSLLNVGGRKFLGFMIT